MLFYMQMRNWFLVFLILTMTYLVYQKSGTYKRFALQSSTLASIIR